MDTDEKISSLKRISIECRSNIISMLEKSGSGHPGGSLSVTDILVALFFSELSWDPSNPSWSERDRVILSKGHGVPALYAILAEMGVIPKEELFTLRRVDSRLQGHPDRVRFPFVEASTGSLGQGLSIAQGIALGLKLQKISARVFCILGDGECQEGQIWEAAMSAPKFHLNNLVVFLDSNKGQLDGFVDQIMDLKPITEKWKSFGWSCHEIDGHDFKQILETISLAKAEAGRPTMIVANTIKGKGVSFMENRIEWHGCAPNPTEASQALMEIRGKITNG